MGRNPGGGGWVRGWVSSVVPSGGFYSYSSYRIGIPNGVGFLSYRSTSLLSREPTRGRPQLIFLPASGVPWFLQAEGRTKSDLEAPRCQVLRMADQCERNPLCSRGFKHRGHGGHCCIGKLSKPHKGDSTVEMAKQVRETAAAKPRADQCERNPNCTRGFKHGGKGGHCSFVQAATASSLRQSSGSGKGGSSISISTIGSATASSSRRTARQASLDEARSKPGASGGGGGSGSSGSSGGSDSSGGGGGGTWLATATAPAGECRYAGACVHVLDAVQQCMQRCRCSCCSAALRSAADRHRRLPHPPASEWGCVASRPVTPTCASLCHCPPPRTESAAASTGFAL